MDSFFYQDVGAQGTKSFVFAKSHLGKSNLNLFLSEALAHLTLQCESEFKELLFLQCNSLQEASVLE